MPRWGAGPDDDWYPWLGRELRYLAPRLAFRVIPLRPSPDAPEPQACVAGIRRLLSESADGPTLLVGHSVGCQALLRALASDQQLGPIAGLVCVAGWWSVDEPWDAIQPWLALDYDIARARAAVPAATVLVSDNDPFTADHKETSRAWRVRLGARVCLCHDARHFNGTEEPAVLAAIRPFLARSS